MSASISVKLSGVASIRNVAQHHGVLLDALNEGGDMSLDLGAAEDVDLAFVQLILAARRSAEARGVSLTLSDPAPKPILQVLERGGFIGPAPDHRRQFWLAQ